MIQFNIPASDPHHFYYKNDGVAGQVTLANIAVTTASDDSTIADIDPDWAHSWWSIQPTTSAGPSLSLPVTTDPVIIDGYSQTGASANTHAMTDPDPSDNAVLRIEIDGTFAGPDRIGLAINSGNTTVEGLVVNRFSGYGIIVGAYGFAPIQNDTLQGNFVGTDVSGSIAKGNTILGIVVETIVPR